MQRESAILRRGIECEPFFVVDLNVMHCDSTVSSARSQCGNSLDLPKNIEIPKNSLLRDRKIADLSKWSWEQDSPANILAHAHVYAHVEFVTQ